jgi:poly-beta-1,6-N-acetyl-D-glucosamine synthase
LAHYDVRFEPRALCWILMPETLSGLWKQRVRWAMGGVQVILKNLWMLASWRKRRMWMILIEYTTSVIWAYSMAFVMALWLLGLIVPLPPQIYVDSILPRWHGVIIGTTCLIQFATSMWMDSHYDHRLMRYYVWMIWYPLAFWLLTMTTTVWAVPKVILRKKGKRAVWVSPDRGVGRPAPRE